jgi:hypothetical protein
VSHDVSPFSTYVSVDARSPVIRKPVLLICLLLLPAVDISGAQVVRQDSARSTQGNRSGTWAARTSTGVTLMGTWTGEPDSTGTTVIGTWTVADAQGKTVANGAWSAAKSPDRWTGAWRSAMAGRSGEYAGTWSSGVDLNGRATFADLFEKAVQDVVSGTWRAGGQAGAWSIRTLKRDAP